MKPDGEIVEHINKDNGILNDRVWAVFEDKDYNIWLGLDKGISKIEYGVGLRYFDEKDGFEGRSHKIVSFQNQLYLATIQGLYSKDQAGGFKNIMNNQDLYWDIEFIKDSFKTMAVASKSGLLVKNNISKLFIEGDFRDITIFKNEVYAIANNTLYKVSVDTKGIISREKQEAKTDDIVQQIEFDQHENIWLGLLDNGIKQVINPFKSNCTLRAYDTTSGLPDIIANKPILFDNQIYFLTTAGLYQFDKNKFIKSKLHTNWFGKDSLQIWSFFKDSKNRCWMQINRFTKGASVNIPEVGYYDLNKKRWVCNVFKRLPQTLVNGFSEDANGNIYMASDEGVFIFENKEHQIKDFNVNFSFIRSGSDTLLEYAQIMPNGNFTVINEYSLSKPILYNQMPLLINFSNPFFNLSGSTEYSYLLDGESKTWSEWSKEDKKEYTKLSPGTFTFKVKARNIFGDESPVNSFTFKILPPWYLTWWAYIIYLVSFVAIIYGIVQLSIYRLKQAKIKLESIVTERTVEVVKQKDEILEQKSVLEKQKLAIERFNEELSHKNKEITDSIQYAKKIQEAILVEEQTIYNQLPESFILYKPRDIVSGDFYWYHELEEGIMIAAADCTGHGVPGAFMSMIGSTLLNEIVEEKKITSPDAILNQLNIEVRRSLKQDEETSQSRDGMDIALCKINISSANLKYAGAMRPLYIVRKLSEGPVFEEIKATKNPIGGKQAEEKREFILHDFNFNKGDTVYLFSDGYADQFGGPEGKKFMTKKFQHLLLSINHESMPIQKQLINQAFENWKGELEQVDDVLVIGVRF
jgi:serine phosphatase RsbU (regulator of sigma subunit)